jgi:hypothetical protein
MADTTPLLRTLSPALRSLDRNLRGWLDGPRRYPLSTIARATLEGLSADLQRQAEALDVDRPLLVIILMGGTGVGKSTLLNALAGGKIAQASVARPTTRDPVVYYHESIRQERLDPALRHCRLAPHDREGLEHKVIVDTPDLDSNDLANREKLMHILPVADIVLYAGSQEKYHDQIGWELFLQQRKRRGFAFILNKWDRCLHAGGIGLRPDEDLIRDLEQQGFKNPLVFRTCAQHWVDLAEGKPPSEMPPLPEGEQFQELVQWLEMGLTRLEIEAIKTRGVSQLLTHLGDGLRSASPPDLTEVAKKTRAAWQAPLEEEARTAAQILLNTLDPYQREIEHHFALEGQKRFGGIMAAYLGFYNRMKYFGSTLKERFPLTSSDRSLPSAAAWDLGLFTQACSDAAVTRQMEARGKALIDRLLVQADAQGFPVKLLNDAVDHAGERDWRGTIAAAISDTLRQLEHEWTNPSGGRGFFQMLLIFLADWLPLVALFGGFLRPLFLYFDIYGSGQPVHFSDFLLPFVLLLAVLIILHLLIAVFMPLRWSAIRGDFAEALEKRLTQDFEAAYGEVPHQVAELLLAERKKVEAILNETREVEQWLSQREQSASIASLYGT